MQEVIIFTDGSCSNNGKPGAKGGYGVHFPNKECEDVSEKFELGNVTNNRAELYAIYVALDKLNNLKFDNAIIYTDSKYAIGCMINWYPKWKVNGFVTTGKKPIANNDIIIKIHEIYSKYDNIKILYVKGHKKDGTFMSIGNDMADKLAKKYTVG